MTDRSKQTLNIYKDDKLVTSGEVGQTSVFVSLPGGTTAADGEYKGTFKDAEGNESVKADFPGFEVPADTVAVTGVTMSQKTASMTVGDTKVITATVAPDNATNKAVTYKSSDESVATVASDGTVTALAEGSADITATTVDGGFTDKCTVTVNKPIVKVTGVTINPTTANIEVGKTTKLTATVQPENATNRIVSYKSSDESVATVASDGTVTGVKAGTADITVTTQESGFTAKCTVTVKNPVVPVTGLALNKSATSITVGNTEQLTANISPSNATDKTVTWSSSDTSVATVSSTGLVTGFKAGTANIVARSKDGAKSANCVVTVTEPNASATDGATA